MKKIVTIGGGSGHSQVLKGLKSLPEIQITAICPSTDSGGSTGVLQKEYEGRGYVGDLTKCFVALCDNDHLGNALMYRYENGPLDSHSVKNLLFHSLEKTNGTDEALRLFGEICHLGRHKVLPITKEKVELCAKLSIGNTISGETNIDNIALNPLWNPDVHQITDIYLKPSVKASSDALKAFSEADYIIISPGDLYSSVIPVLLPRGVKEAIKKSKAKIILMLNIMTKRGETDNYTGRDFIQTIEERLGKKSDYIIANNAAIPKEVLLKYSLESKVALKGLDKSSDSKIIFAPLAVLNEKKQIVSNPEIIKKTVSSIID